MLLQSVTAGLLKRAAACCFWMQVTATKTTTAAKAIKPHSCCRKARIARRQPRHETRNKPSPIRAAILALTVGICTDLIRPRFCHKNGGSACETALEAREREMVIGLEVPARRRRAVRDDAPSRLSDGARRRKPADE